MFISILMIYDIITHGTSGAVNKLRHAKRGGGGGGGLNNCNGL